MNTTHATLSNEQQTTLLALLKARFLQHMNRHEGLSWTAVEQRLMTQPQKLYALSEIGVLLVAEVSAMTKLPLRNEKRTPRAAVRAAWLQLWE
jgi:predicted transcriptional regulator